MTLRHMFPSPIRIAFVYHLLSFLFVLSTAGRISAQAPVKISINNGWEFVKAETTSPSFPVHGWKPVSLPHSWNNEDVDDDEPGYYRGIGWYRRRLTIDSSFYNGQTTLLFEGVNQVATVFVNGNELYTHTGGYSAFEVTIPTLLKLQPGVNANELLVRVDNRYNEQVPPLTADFTFFGGIYRDVWLTQHGNIRFQTNQYGGSLFVSTPVVNHDLATVNVKSTITNNEKRSVRAELVNTIFDKNGKLVVTQTKRLNLAAGPNSVNESLRAVKDPQLWSPANPYLYTLETTIRETGSGRVLDTRRTTVGFRWFRFDAANGFFLNDKPLKLVGASRHQDRPHLGNAVPDELARQDLQWLKQMGGNFLRVAHYPQDPSILEACDRMGILASVEIPVVNEITESDTFYNRCDTMVREMIHQAFNHPSVIIWCYMNEVLLRPHFNNDRERQQLYFDRVTALAERLEKVVRNEDSSRYTMIAHHGDFDRYKKAKLIDIPMIVGWNLYSGWYGGNLEQFANFLDRHHREFPKKPLVVSEYGADADPRIRSARPVRFDKSVEYTTRFHQYYWEQIRTRPFVAAAMIWNLADFNSETRAETMPHINNKGLLTWNREPKDPYYFYKAVLSEKPYLKILNTPVPLTTGLADSAAVTCTQDVSVATNLSPITLWHNGKKIGTASTESGLVTWAVPFVNGMNILEAVTPDGKFNEKITIDFTVIPRFFHTGTPAFDQVNLLFGGDRFFIDPLSGLTWIPAPVYSTGSFGSVGGVPYKMPGNNRLPYGTDRNIFGSESDPIYQTQLVGLSSFQMDAPDGEYELIFHFAELTGAPAVDLPYNLSKAAKEGQAAERVFSVRINEQPVITKLNLTAEYGSCRAVRVKTKVAARNGKGIQVRFDKVIGEPVLNALQVRQIN